MFTSETHDLALLKKELRVPRPYFSALPVAFWRKYMALLIFCCTWRRPSHMLPLFFWRKSLHVASAGPRTASALSANFNTVVGVAVHLVASIVTSGAAGADW